MSYIKDEKFVIYMCNRCGNILKADFNAFKDEQVIFINPCKECLANSYEDAYNRGYEDEYNEPTIYR